MGHNIHYTTGNRAPQDMNDKQGRLKNRNMAIKKVDAKGYSSPSSGCLHFRHRALLIVLIYSVIPVANNSDVGGAVRDGQGESYCLEYLHDHKFSLVCDIDWEADDYIKLKEGEIFDGNGHNVTVAAEAEFAGMFTIAQGFEIPQSTPWDSLQQDFGVPKIMNVHVVGGMTTLGGGFIVQEGQRHFIVDSCSSTGVIRGEIRGGGDWDGAGGICGQLCSGSILIVNSYSTGAIKDYSAGGIAGREVGKNDGNVTIKYCYSTGPIDGDYSGGIVGTRAAHAGGELTISQCFTIGDVGQYAGGIVGGGSPHSGGRISVSDSYSRGDIKGALAGGICGRHVGNSGGQLVLKNVYASGDISGSNAGGLIGVTSPAADSIEIINSVYNGPPMIGDDNYGTAGQGISSDLGEIDGKVYCVSDEECWDEETIWSAGEVGGFPILKWTINAFGPSPTPTTSSSASETPTSSISSTPSKSSTPTRTASASMTGTVTVTPSPTRTPSISSTWTRTASRSMTRTVTMTLSPTRTPSSSASPSADTTTTPSRSRTMTSTVTKSRTGIATKTMLMTRTPVKTESVTESAVIIKTPMQTENGGKTISATPTSARTVMPSEINFRIHIPAQYPVRAVIVIEGDEESQLDFENGRR